MITTLNKIKQYCCEDISLIENYDQAINSFEKYDCHHRLEIQENKITSVKELKEQNLYFNRPASELIFLKHSEHTMLHKPHVYRVKGTIKYGEDFKERCRQNMLGKHWYTNGIDNIQCRKCPEGFRPGRTLCVKNNNGSKGFHWYTNGIINVSAKECPEGFRLGRVNMPKPSEETKKKMSIAHSGKNNHFYGKHHSEETKKIISEKGKGRHHSEETRKKMSISAKKKRMING